MISKQGQRYKLGHILFSVFAISCKADSYRKIHSFIKSHYNMLNKLYHLNWKRVPAYTTIRHIIQGVDSAELERGFRQFSFYLINQCANNRYIALDGKTLKKSFDHLNDKKAI